jgi:hypothetical protein
MGRGKKMERKDLEILRGKVSCAAVLESNGWAIDIKESTRRAVKYRRRQGEIIIVTHNGLGWFDPLSDAKGDVFALSRHLGKFGFVDALDEVSQLTNFRASEPMWRRPVHWNENHATIAARWAARPRIKRGSANWLYLKHTRGIPPDIIELAIAQDCIREGPYGSVWAAHRDFSGMITGWEERGPEWRKQVRHTEPSSDQDHQHKGWRSFASGGSKRLFQLYGAGLRPSAPNFPTTEPLGLKRLCVTEAAIDALSLAAFEMALSELFEGTLYVSTGGGWSGDAGAQLCKFAQTCGLHLVAATDRNQQGDIYAERLRLFALEAGCQFSRLLPAHEDWNEDLKRLPRVAAGSDRRQNETEILKENAGTETCCRVPEGARQG